MIIFIGFKMDKKIIKNQEGSTLVEFAIVFPLLLILIFGVIEFGLFLFNTQVITNAAREGARRGIIMREVSLRNTVKEDAEIRDRVIEFAQQHLITFGSDVLESNSTDIPINRPADPFLNGSNLQVQVNYKYHFLFLSTIGIGPIDIQGDSNMKME